MMFDYENRSRPILKWAGGKTSTLPHLIKTFPPVFKRYLEPFIGGGAVFLALKPGVPALLGDSNPELISLYETVRDFPGELMIALDGLAAKYSQDFYYELRKTVPENKIDRAARTIFLNKTGFNGLFRENSKGEFNVPFGKRVKCPALYESANIRGVSQRLEAVKFHCGDFEEVINTAMAGDFVYCDPPYEPVSKSASFTSYVKNGFSQDAQIRLRDSAARAIERGAFVAISNSSAPFILESYKDWNVTRVSAARAINCKGTRRGAVDEILATKIV